MAIVMDHELFTACNRACTPVHGVNSSTLGTVQCTVRMYTHLRRNREPVAFPPRFAPRSVAGHRRVARVRAHVLIQIHSQGAAPNSCLRLRLTPKVNGGYL